MTDIPVVHAEGAEQEEASNLGFFFKGAGALRFHATAEPEVPGSSQTIAVADRFGVVVFSDLQGAHGGRAGRGLGGGEEGTGPLFRGHRCGGAAAWPGRCPEPCNPRLLPERQPVAARPAVGVYVATTNDLLKHASSDDPAKCVSLQSGSVAALD
jgi:hypothetical protein